MATPPKRTVPSEFIRLDATATAADEFANVRDLQVIRDNHNMIMGRQLRRHIATDHLGRVEIRNGYALNRRQSKPIYYLPLNGLPPGRKSISVKLEARAVDAEVDVKVYAIVDSSDMRMPDEMSGAAAVTVSGTSYVYYTFSNVSIPENRTHGAGGGVYLYLYMEGGVTGADIMASNPTITQVGSNGTRVTFTNGVNVQPGQVLWCPSDLSIGQRMIIGRQTNGTVQTVWVDRPFGKLPIVDTDTAQAVKALGIRGGNIIVYEDSISNPDADTEFPVI
jgi:hypothetical protein